MKLFAPILAWIIALACLSGAAYELNRQRKTADLSAALAQVPRFSLKTSNLELADYQAIQKKTLVFGSIKLLTGPEGLSIKASAISDYAAWRLTVDQVLLDNPGVAWRIDYLCTGKCPSEDAHKALLTGTRRSGVAD